MGRSGSCDNPISRISIPAHVLIDHSDWNEMVVTLEELLELSLAGRTLSSWRYLEVNCGSCSLFPRDVKHTHFDFFGGGREFGVEILLPVCQDHGRIM